MKLGWFKSRFEQGSVAVPEFTVKTTAGVMLSGMVLVLPFCINNLVNERYLLSGLSFIIAALCAISALSCHKGEYSWGINLFVLTPVIMITIPLITYQQGLIGTFWAFLAVLAFYVILTERIAWFVNALFILIMIPVSWLVVDIELFVRFVIMLLITSAFAAIFIRIINAQHDLLEEQVVTDPLTGLYNRTLLQTSLEQAIHQYQRASVQMSLIMMDIDHFKSINDELGHDKGDEVLKSFSKRLKESFRGTDKVFRLGGEEFLALVYDANTTKASNIAEKLRADIEENSMIPERRVTLSLGVAGIEKTQDWNQWLISCDKKLYTAKHKGRNQVVA
ncbi:MAG: GGDEF domain-containing protein [Sedimenticola sp.]